MDFGDVLEEWERSEREDNESSNAPAAKKGRRDSPDKDAESDIALNAAQKGLESRRLADAKPQAFLDLHGLTGEEAEAAIAAFIEEASRRGLEKVLVIHGKGLHSSGAPVLKKAARRALEAHPLAGRFGEAVRTEGGSGALWVIIKRRR
jgi:DNA-nicking Smr family endonuclease